MISVLCILAQDLEKPQDKTDFIGAHQTDTLLLSAK